MTMDQNFKQAEKAADVLEQQAEKEMLQAYRESLKEIRSQIGLTYEKYAVAGALVWSEMQKYNRLNALEKAIAKQIKALTGKETLTTTKAIEGVFQESYYRSAWVLETGAEVSLNFNLLKPEAVEASILNPLDRITWPERVKDNAKVMNRQIREEISRGIIQGYSYDKTARAVKERMDVGASKALRIVQTETHRAQSQGTQAAYEKATAQGLVFKKVWMATLDGRTRDRHRSLDGQKVDIDKPFKMSGMEAMYPGGFGTPEMDINCRCTVRAEIEGMEPDLRRARDPQTGKNVIIPNMTYEEWYNTYIEKGLTEGIIGSKLPGNIEIKSVSVHAIRRMQAREVSRDDVIDTLTSPLKINKPKTDSDGKLSQRIYGAKSTVTINPETGRVVTVWKTSKKIQKKYKKEG